MTRLKSLTGERFGKLVVVDLHHERTKAGMSRWKCQCDCGNTTVVSVCNLGKNTNSCGCIRNTAGGASNRPGSLYRRFLSMHERCSDPACKDYLSYGGRAIYVCDRWHNFLNFEADMLPGFKRGMSLDRIDNDGPYAPENCKWSTPVEQLANRRVTRSVETPWGKMTVAAAARRSGLSYGTIVTRLDRGWTGEEIFRPENARRLTKWDRKARRAGQ